MKVSSRGGFTLVRIFQNATSYILTYSVYIYEHRFIHIHNFLMIPINLWDGVFGQVHVKFLRWENVLSVGIYDGKHRIPSHMFMGFCVHDFEDLHTCVCSDHSGCTLTFPKDISHGWSSCCTGWSSRRDCRTDARLSTWGWATQGCSKCGYTSTCGIE